MSVNQGMVGRTPSACHPSRFSKGLCISRYSVEHLQSKIIVKALRR
jgi:hypothetical protein